MDNHQHYAFELPPAPYYLGCGKSEYSPGEQHPNRRHLGIFDLLLVVKGTLFMGENGRTWELTEGHMLLLSPDGHHYPTGSCTSETVFYWLHFEYAGPWTLQEETTNLYPPSGQPFANRYTLRIPQAAQLAQVTAARRIFDELLELAAVQRSSSFWQEMALFMQLWQLLEQEGRPHHSSPVRQLAEKTETFIKQNYQRELTNETLSAALHFHSNYIVRCMKDVYGCTPSEFLHNYRIDQAKRLLINTVWPIAQIAEHVGFTYTPYFSSCFHRKVGVSPLQFRKQYVH
ncbi:helix-turn-helix transcriptional regulator [Paenibacillus whitsoniae]|uniref:AraC family transcriptional regulator n=1 Tax=Paenibacillus whitsoniae TaxID=2496558 RepID=A0A3S0AS58_9BACL|nr:AraC family transcriptional regulator [Paenibacillus whitsoniae]RTE11390.1 AraC family transcriptional regulator [Paenibacillus whitsoniae]